MARFGRGIPIRPTQKRGRPPDSAPEVLPLVAASGVGAGTLALRATVLLHNAPVNLVHNPSLEVDVVGFEGHSTVDADATQTRITSDSYVGGACGEVVTTVDHSSVGFDFRGDVPFNSLGRTIACAPGDIFSLRAAVKKVSAAGFTGIYLYGSFRNAAGTILGDLDVSGAGSNTGTDPGTGVWLDVFGTLTVPATVGGQVPAFIYLKVQIYRSGTGPATIRGDAAQIVKVASTTDYPAYRDGSLTGSFWLGTANATQSATALNAGGVGTGNLSLTAPTRIPLVGTSAVGSGSLLLTTPTIVPLASSAGVGAGSLSVKAPTYIPMGAGAGLGVGILALTAPTRVPLVAASGVGTGTLALAAPTQVSLVASSGVGSGSLGLTTPTFLTLQPARASSVPLLPFEAQIAQATGLRSWWRLNETSMPVGADAAGDSGPLGVPLTNYSEAGNAGNPSIIPGAVGGKSLYRGPGATQHLANPSVQAAFQSRTAFTFGGWIKPDNTTSQKQVILSDQQAAPQLQLVGYGGHWYVTCFQSAVFKYAFMPNGVVAGVSQFIVGRYNGETLDLFKDGVRVGSNPLTGQIDPVSGKFHVGVSWAYFYNLEGYLQDIFYADLAMSDAEIKAIYDSGAGSPRPQFLTAPTRVPLSVGVGAGTGTLALTAPTQIPLAAASGAGTGTLALRTPVLLHNAPINHIRNPNFEVDTSGVFSNGVGASTWSRITNDSKFGAACLEIVSDSAGEGVCLPQRWPAGARVDAGIWMKGTADTIGETVRLILFNFVGSDVVASANVTLQSVWTYYTIGGTATYGAENPNEVYQFFFVDGFGATAIGTWLVDGVAIIHNGSPSPGFFDGNDIGKFWLGATNGSESATSLSAGGVGAGALALTSPAFLTLGSGAAVGVGVLALTAPAQVGLAPASAVSTASLTVTTDAPISGVMSGVGSGALTLTAPTQVPLSAAVGTGVAALALTVPTQISLNASSGVGLASLALTAPASLQLNASAGVGVGSLALTALTYLGLQATSGVGSGALLVTAPTRVLLVASSGQGAGTLALTAPVLLSLSASSGVGTGSLALTAHQSVSLDPANAVGSASLSLTAVPRLTLTASASGTGTLALEATTYLGLDSTAAVGSTSLLLSVPTGLPLAPATGSGAGSTAAITTPAYLSFSTGAAGSFGANIDLEVATNLLLDPASAVSYADLFLSAPAGLDLAPSNGQAAGVMQIAIAVIIPLDAASGVGSAAVVLTFAARLTLSQGQGQGTTSWQVTTSGALTLFPAVGLADGFINVETGLYLVGSATAANSTLIFVIPTALDMVLTPGAGVGDGFMQPTITQFMALAVSPGSAAESSLWLIIGGGPLRDYGFAAVNEQQIFAALVDESRAQAVVTIVPGYFAQVPIGSISPVAEIVMLAMYYAAIANVPRPTAETSDADLHPTAKIEWHS